MNIDATLTRAERELPFKIEDAPFDPIEGPTRLALEIEVDQEAYWFVERDLRVSTDPVQIIAMPRANH